MADLSVDVQEMVLALQSVLAGQSIPWAQEPDGLKSLVLGYTPFFHFQSAELKDALKRAGVLRRVDKKEVCVFPPIGTRKVTAQ